MAEQLLTKCPHCGTTFRLSQQHLQIAGGAVRCGACYQVFHASEYIVKTAVVEEIVTPPPATPQQAPLPDPLADFNIDEVEGLDAYNSVDFDLPNPDEDLFADDYHKKLVDGGNDDTGLNFDNENDNRPASQNTEKGKRSQSEDWAKQLLEELGEKLDDDDDDQDNFTLRKRPASAPATPSNTRFSTIQSGDEVFSEPDVSNTRNKVAGPPNTRATPKPKRLEEELSDSFKSLGLKGFSDDPFSIDDLDEEHEKPTSGDVDESWAKAMLEELEGDKPLPTMSRMDTLDFALEEDDEEEESPFAARPLSRSKDEAMQKARERNARLGAPEPRKFSADSTDAEESAISSFGNDFLDDLNENALEIEDINLEDAVGALSEMENVPEPAPVKMSSADIAAKVRAHAAQLAMEQAPKPQYFRMFAFSVGSLILLLALIAQAAYFKFNEFSRWPQLRPVYALACEKLGCKLPAQTDTSKIRGSNLVVRSHPSMPNALSVDFMISNEAYFSQPFPIIELTFEDLNENLVASRGFLPKEYINDPAIDPKNMPPNTPFHIGLEIVDPDPKAANYRLRYLPVPE